MLVDRHRETIMTGSLVAKCVAVLLISRWPLSGGLVFPRAFKQARVRTLVQRGVESKDHHMLLDVMGTCNCMYGTHV
jgi:hypothetical protein